MTEAEKAIRAALAGDISVCSWVAMEKPRASYSDHGWRAMAMCGERLMVGARVEDVRQTEDGVVTKGWNNEALATYIASVNPAAITELLAEVDRLRVDAEKSEKRARMFSGIMHDHILAMQAAAIDYELNDADTGIQWIVNTLLGPGHYPDIEAAKAIGGAQAYFDAETEKEEKRLAAIDAARLEGKL